MVARTRSSKVNRAWLQDHLNDPYVRLAQADGYRSRAAYKLKEIDETFRLLRPGQVVVDLGAAPGAWSQYLRRRFADRTEGGLVDGKGVLIAIDLLPMEPIEGVRFLQGDFREEAAVGELERALDGRAVDVVVSDMAPNLSGIAAADAARMADLVELAVDFSVRHLCPDGALVAKVFHGSGYSQLVQRFKQAFRIAKPYKPKASRGRSAETFLVGIGLKQQARSEKGGDGPGNPGDSAARKS